VGLRALGIERLALWTLPGNVLPGGRRERRLPLRGLARNWELDRDDRPIDAVMYSMTPDDLADAGSRRPTGGCGERPFAAVPRELWAAGTRAAPFVQVAAIAELTPGSMRRVTLAGLDLLVAWTPTASS
jgi:hypothetical protein